jgi:hypothetical protein
VRLFVAAGVALVLSASNVVAQAGSNASPADVARDFFAAERDGRWLDAAQLLDLRAFEVQRDQDVASARRPRPNLRLTVEQVRRSDPDMPRAVAEYYVKKAATRSRDYNPFSHQYANVTSANTLAALPVDVAAARWLEAKDPRWQMKSHSEMAGCRPPQDADSIFKPAPRRVIAAANIGPSVPGSLDSVSYVLFRDSHPDLTDSTARVTMAKSEMAFSPDVLTLVLTPTGWRIVPVLDFGLSGGAVWGFGCMSSVDAIKPRPK